MSESTKTLCPYCGVGCGLQVTQSEDLIGNQQPAKWKVTGDRSHPSNVGLVCVKGATVAETIDKNRLEYPLLRDSLDQPFRRVSWDIAYQAIVDRMQDALKNDGPDSICMYGSGQFQTEDYYVAQKLLKGCLGTNNFDANSRLCMSSAVAGYTQSLGSDGPPCCYEDLELTDCAFIIGSNTAECHPIVFNRLYRHVRKNSQVKLIVVDPRKTKTAQSAHLHLAIKPGTDIDLLNGIAHLLIKWGKVDLLFIEECTNNFREYTQTVSKYTPELVSRNCGIPIEQIIEAAKYWSQSKKVLSLWSMGVNQSSEGTAKVSSIINLHLLTGNIGREGCGPFSLTGQPNAMGGREAGGLAHLLPGYRSVKKSEDRSDVEQFWGLAQGSISSNPGKTAWEMITALESNEVKVLWIAATNPAVSMPDLRRTKSALLSSPFTIYQDAFYPTETASYAHLVLPAAAWGEKTGVMTNSERVVTLCKAFRDPLGEAKPDWQIFAQVGRRLGFEKQFDYVNSAQVYKEFAELTKNRLCDISGLSHEKLAKKGPQQWPYPAVEIKPKEKENPGLIHSLFHHDQTKPTKRLYEDLNFSTPNKKAKFKPHHSQGLAEPITENFPFVLTVGRVYGHWHTQSRTAHVEKINKMHPSPFIEINTKDAVKLGISQATMVEVKSSRGSAIYPAVLTDDIRSGTVFVPMHWGALWSEESESNNLTHSISCPISGQPELKACAVNIYPIKQIVNQDAWHGTSQRKLETIQL